jgi:hypothetical protein
MFLAFLFFKDLFEGEYLGDFEGEYFLWDLIGNRDSEIMKMKSVRADMLRKSLIL